MTAITRVDIAGYVEALIDVYSLLLIAYVLIDFFFVVGGRLPLNRVADGVLNFLRQVSEPYLNLYRRFIPLIGPLDISPLVGLLVLQLVGRLLVHLIAG